MDDALSKGVVHRLWETDHERLAGFGLGGANLPMRGIWRLPIGRRNCEMLLKAFLQRLARPILPPRIDEQGIMFSVLQGGADFLQRTNSAFDPAWIDEQGQPRHLRIPQLLI